MINCMTDWIHNWKKNNWKTGKCQPVINKEEILELEKACKCLESVKWVNMFFSFLLIPGRCVFNINFLVTFLVTVCHKINSDALTILFSVSANALPTCN